MGIEQAVNYQLNKVPGVKKFIKRGYQIFCYALSRKIKVEGDVQCVSPQDDNEYFFGYYDKSPWDASGRYMLCMRADDTWSDPAPSATADILLIDLYDRSTRIVATTRSWNVQQACMAQWLGPSYDSEIIYNDFRNDAYCSVVLNVTTGTERVLPQPVYAVASDGQTALTLDFSRLHTLRKGYGYSNAPDATEGVKVPEGFCVWKMDVHSGAVAGLLTYQDIVEFEPRAEMAGATHKVNHLMINPSGTRFMVLHRWVKGQRKYTRLLTCSMDGTQLYNLSDDDMVSHCFWKSDDEIVAFENKHESGPGYYLMKDMAPEYKHFWSELSNDGHPSYSPDRSRIVTDTYPDRARIASVKLLDEADPTGKDARIVARVFAPFKYDNDTRCDLHPRWRRDGGAICFDAVFEGRRRLYVVGLGEDEERC